MRNYDVVQFKNVGGVNAPTKPWPMTFIIAYSEMYRNAVVLHPATVTGLIRAIARNLITMNYGRLLRLLWRAGFLDVPEAVEPGREHLRAAFWRPRVGMVP